ncbi:anti-sigma factor [uncultured Cellulomonas sp.]|uniref:anti-sigma factor family protein n=1 Tax=uncultured Cellulomonas sp. TaxID=189682 RepID=UPI0026318C9E|nr:zf-HC2 domain-containing protein [uncultured Cellulomonas sp.]
MSTSDVAPDPFEMDDAAYVLGALSPQERARYEAHLQTCDACTRSVTELAGLPGVLRRLPADVVESLDDVTAADDDGADAGASSAVLARVVDAGEREDRRERRVRTLRWASALTTAAAALVVAALAWFGPGAGGRDEPPPPTAQVDFSALGATELSASASLREVAWGTKIELECAYPPELATVADGEQLRYSLVVHDTAGTSQQVATWNAVAGRELTIDAATAVRAPDIDRLEVLAEDGTVLLRAAR